MFQRIFLLIKKYCIYNERVAGIKHWCAMQIKFLWPLLTVWSVTEKKWLLSRSCLAVGDTLFSCRHCCKEVVVVEMFDKNSQCMGCLPGQKSGCCREVVVEDRWLWVAIQLYHAKVLPQRFYLNGNTILNCIHRMTKCLSITWSKSPYNGLYGESVPERGTFFRLQVYERVGISLVEVHKRLV